MRMTIIIKKKKKYLVISDRGRVAGLHNGNFPDGLDHLVTRWPDDFMDLIELLHA